MARQRKTSALVVPIEGDARGFRRELLAARGAAAESSESITRALGRVGKALGDRQGDVKAVSGEFLRFGSSAASALGPVQGVVDTLLGALRSGGPLMVGLLGLATGVGLLASRLKDAREEARQLDALTQVTGITRRQIDELRESLERAGVSLSRLDASALAKVAREAKISREELEANARAIQALATLEGTSFANAAATFFEALRGPAEETRKAIEAIQTAIDQIRHGAEDPILAAGEARIQQLQEEREELRRTLRAYQEAEEEAYRAMIARPSRERQRAFAEATRRREEAEAGPLGQRFTQGIEQEIQAIEDRLVAYQLEREAAEEAAKAEERRRMAAEERRKREAEEAAKAEARERQALQTALAAAEARGDAEEAIRLRYEARIRHLEELARKELIAERDLETEKKLAREQADREREALLRESLRRQEDYELAHRARLAAITESRLDDLEVARERELAAVQRQLEDEVIAVEEAERRKADIREYYRALREKAAREEAEKVAKKEAEEAEKARKTEEQAYAHGIAISTALMTGLAEGAKQGDARQILRGILGVASMAASIFGGPVVGAAVGGLASLFAGFFRDGGYVSGPRSSKRDNLLGRFEAGEFIVNREATARHRGLLEAINAGLPPSLLGAFLGPAAAAPAASAAGGGVTQVFVAALDPQQTADVLAQRLEPAQRQRGMTRQDEALVAQARPRLLRRTGRRR